MGRSYVLLLAALLPAGLPHLQWTDRQALPVPVAGGAAGVLGERLIYAGGTTWNGGVKRFLRDVSFYEPATDRWSPGPPLPAPWAYGAYTRSGDVIEIFGGSDGEKTYRESWRLDRSARTWKTSGSAPLATLLGRADVIVGRTYLFGGCADVVDLTTCGSAVQVRGSNGEWKLISRIPSGAVAMPAGVMVNNRVYLFGGCSMTTLRALVNRAEASSFDPAVNRWRQLRPMPRANRGLTAAVLDSHHILLIGGYTATQQEAAGQQAGFGFTSAVLVYDIEKDTYAEMNALPFPVSGMEVLSYAGSIFGMGGEHRMRERSDRLLMAAMPR